MIHIVVGRVVDDDGVSVICRVPARSIHEVIEIVIREEAGSDGVVIQRFECVQRDRVRKVAPVHLIVVDSCMDAVIRMIDLIDDVNVVVPSVVFVGLALVPPSLGYPVEKASPI
mgnify:FL=1